MISDDGVFKNDMRAYLREPGHHFGFEIIPFLKHFAA